MSQPLIVSFRPDAAQMCLDGRKAMTRRIFKPGMALVSRMDGSDASIQDTTRNGRKIWAVGETCAIKPKRTAKAIGRVLITGLRAENVQDITEEDAKREGVEPVSTFVPDGLGRGGELEYRSYREGFKAVWKRLNPRGSLSWDANPVVVVIEFKPIPKEDL